MIQVQRIPMSDVELAAVDALIAAHPDERISLTRRDPGETGPVLVHVGSAIYEVAEDGTVGDPVQETFAPTMEGEKSVLDAVTDPSGPQLNIGSTP